MTVPYIFATASSAIPLSQLDANFATPITIGTTNISLGNTASSLANVTLSNVTISSGSINITNISFTNITVTNLATANRFEGIATDDSGTPDAIFRVNRTHAGAASPHSFRDQTIFSPSTSGIAAASFDAALSSQGSNNLDHIIAFQARNVHNGTGTLSNIYGLGSYPIVNSGTVTNVYGADIAAHSGTGTVINEYGIYIRNQSSAATNKYPIFIPNSLGKNVIGAETNFNNSGVVSVGSTVKIFMGDAGNGYKSVAYNHNMQSNTYDYADQIQSMYFGPTDITFRWAASAAAGTTPTFTNLLFLRNVAGANLGALYPGANGTQKLGISGQGWSEVFASNGTINTSDARVKTKVRNLNDAELAAAKELAKEIGAFSFLDSIAKKGKAARTHIGMTVQRCIEIMDSHGLNAMSYGFICYDEWEAEYEDHAATYHQVTNENGDLVQGGIKETAWRETKREAGNTYGFRSDQLLLFIARGFEARLNALENI
jgi:hypothetical protein